MMEVAITGQVVVFEIKSQQFALSLDCVERAVRAVAITDLPRAPDVIAGIIDLHGRIIPVINLRRRLRMSERTLRLSDHFLIACTSRRSYAFLVDAVIDVAQYADTDFVQADTVISGMEYLQGVIRFHDGLVFIQDIDKFLSVEEEQLLSDALNK